MKSAILGAILVGLSFTAQAADYELCIAMERAARAVEASRVAGIEKYRVIDVLYEQNTTANSRKMITSIIDYIYAGGTPTEVFDDCMRNY
jgi:opacity protein-like surface antigen